MATRESALSKNSYKARTKGLTDARGNECLLSFHDPGLLVAILATYFMELLIQERLYKASCLRPRRNDRETLECKVLD